MPYPNCLEEACGICIIEPQVEIICTCQEVADVFVELPIEDALSDAPYEAFWSTLPGILLIEPSVTAGPRERLRTSDTGGFLSTFCVGEDEIDWTFTVLLCKENYIWHYLRARDYFHFRVRYQRGQDYWFAFSAIIASIDPGVIDASSDESVKGSFVASQVSGLYYPGDPDSGQDNVIYRGTVDGGDSSFTYGALCIS